MNRVRSSAVVRLGKLTKADRFVARSTPSNPVGSISVLGTPNVRWISGIAGNGPSVSLALTVAAGLPVALWTYKVGLSAVWA